MKKLKITPTESYNWNSSAASCTIYPTFKRHSGEYWCEDAEGNTSDVLNISITAGSVILESPVLPVEEGDNVTLHCKKKKSSSDLIADFYKDGLHIKTGYKGSMTLYNVSTSDEGLYKCNIIGAGQSPESRLLVRGQQCFKTCKGLFEETHPSHSHSLNLLIMLLLLPLLLLVLGVIHCRKHKDKVDKTEGSTARGNVSYRPLRAETSD
ncbi:low affinity immunoglobulin gamma Fc region receptor III-like [Morone saxatilis]|uniref:low affinity immunoglobulin gamma Fc region receptor III-like n=1 Tax=Morone saxatilis TaxID=34816 RepID=UPI0015E1BABA|nr:low affinity immunoglobulin gamma Fc region receptor III-like [Morone saxatilis]